MGKMAAHFEESISNLSANVWNKPLHMYMVEEDPEVLKQRVNIYKSSKLDFRTDDIVEL